MPVELSDWDLDDIKSKLSKQSLFENLQLYQLKKKELNEKGNDYGVAVLDKNELGKTRAMKEFDFVQKEQIVIAIYLADALSE
ncbi:hypothetical protein Q7A53_05695 [Halobacillus rhizosphaerae]|uniref:hypothetical protein n=1 Tax=Halobacillus rhizosphaerae TaxID=3064889 RepID=UPI00398B84F7